MPSPKSIYNKVYYVLKTANGPEVSDKGNDLIEELIFENPSIFYTYQFNEVSKENELRLSEKVIKHTVGLCKNHLDLLTTDNRLSEAGKSALGKDKFSRVIARQIFLIFKNYDYDVDDINKVIQDSLQEGIASEELPTSNFIWEKSNCPINKALFSKMLNLLSNCGFAVSSQRKIYLKIQLHE